MNIRQVTSLAVLVLLISCSSSGADISKTIEISTDQLAEIRANPYIGGNGPGGFAAAALSNPGGDSNGEIHFTGFGPYLHEMGFTNNMVITAIDRVDVAEIFADRWQNLRLKDPSAFDAAHYKDLIEYLFAKERGDEIEVAIYVNASVTSVVAGKVESNKERWRIRLPN